MAVQHKETMKSMNRLWKFFLKRKKSICHAFRKSLKYTRKVRQPCTAEREQAKDTAGLMFKSQPSQYTDFPESILLRKIDSGLWSEVSIEIRSNSIKSLLN